MGQRTDNASRSPVFRQAYWRAVYDMLPYMSGKMRQIMLDGGEYTLEGKTVKIAGARNSNLPEENLLSSKLRYSGKIGLVEIPLKDSFQIDSEEDLELIRKII